MDNNCPNEEILRDFLREMLPDSDQASLAEHVESCSGCQNKLASLADDTQLRELAQHPKTISPHVPTNARKDLDEPTENPVEQLARTIGIRETNRSEEPPEMLSSSGRYELVRIFAKGGLGRVWLAHDRELGRNVALKELRPEKAMNGPARQRFVREAKITGQLEHPNIVPVYELKTDTESGRLYYAMRRVGGKTLREAIADFHKHRQSGEESQVELQKLLRNFVDVCNAVAYAHSRAVVHRDLKPENVLLGDYGEVVVLDWGLAKSGIVDEVDESTHVADMASMIEVGELDLTRDGWVLGTPGYMAPEQASGEIEKIGPRTDVYGLGSILFELLIGREPHASSDLTELIREITDNPPPSPRAINRGIPRALDAISRKAMATAPDDRYENVQALIKDVERFLADEPVSVRRETVSERVGRWFRRHRAGALAGSISLLLIAVVAVVAFLVTLGALDRERLAKDEEATARREAQEAAENERRARDVAETTLQKRGINAADRNLRVRDFSQAGEEIDSVPPSRRGWAWYRMKYEVEQAPRRIGTLGTHDWGITASAISPDGGTLVTAGLDGRVLAWDVTAFRESVLGSIRCEELWTGSWSNRHGQWRASLFRLDGEAEGDLAEDSFLRLAWLAQGNQIVGSSLKGRAVLWNAGNHEREILLEHDRPLCAVAGNPAGTDILLGDDQGLLIHVSRTAEERSTKRIAKLTGECILDVVHVAGGLYVVAQEDGTMSVLDCDADNVVDQQKTAGPVWDLAASAHAETVAAACEDGILRAFNVGQEGRLTYKFEYSVGEDLDSGSPAPLHSVWLDDSKSRLLAGDAAGRLLVWKSGESKPYFIGREPGRGPLQSTVWGKLPTFLRRSFATVVADSGASLVFVAGRNSFIGVWDFLESEGIERFAVGRNPAIRFDPKRSNVLWIADEAGTLSVWDASKGQKLRDVSIKGIVPRSLDLASRTGVAVIAGDGAVRFWQFSEGRLTELREALTHDRPLQCVAISPDASRVAGYDADGYVVLWKGVAGSLLGKEEMGRVESRGGGLVAFNSDGSRLAVAGPGQQLSVFDAVNLRRIKNLAEVTGNGVTVLRWHPVNPDILWFGDTRGTTEGISVSTNAVVREARIQDEVKGLAIDPRGDRVAAVGYAGELRIVDPTWMGEVIKRKVVRDPGVWPTSLDMDAEGRLAAGFANGTIEVWHSAPRPREDHVESTRKWKLTSFMPGGSGAQLKVRPASIALDHEDRAWILYTSVAGQSRLNVGVLSEIEGDWDNHVFSEIDLTQVREGKAHDVARSLALLVSKDVVWAAYRHPRPDKAAYSAQILGFLKRLDPGKSPRTDDWVEVPFSETVANFGDCLQLVEGPNGRPAALHFEWGDYFLTATWWTGTEWIHETVGHRGDGLEMDAIAAPDGWIHVATRRQRFIGDRSPSVYLRFELPMDKIARERLHRERRGELFLTRDGTPIVFCAGTLAKRAGDEWVELGELAGQVTYDPAHDRFFCVRLDTSRRRILLTTYQDGSATTELVHELTSPLADAPRPFVPLVDSSGLPVIVATSTIAEPGWLGIFRTRTDLAATGESRAN
jgi:serine/threonine protein kinase/WD40 repeat protein